MKTQFDHRDEGNINGSITIEPNKKGPGQYIRNLFVGETSRKKGIGTKLLERAIESSQGPFFLEVEESNEVAIQMYKKQGFRIVEKIRAKNGTVYIKMRRD